MNEEQHPGHPGRGGKWAVALLCVGLVAMGAFFLMRSRLHRSDLMTMDPDGTMRLGSVPLSNTNVRDAALTVVGRLNNGTVSFSATGAVTLSNIAGTFQAMQRAGITSVVIRGPNAVPEQKAK